ncbi:MAG: branched-chain amino acid aminotransferase [Rhodospirillaceae bacterium]
MSILPYDDRDGVIWFNGKMVPWREAKVHVLTHGLHYGSCVFEGERFYNGRVFKLTEHSERLARSGELLGFTIPYSVAEIDDATRLTVAAMGLDDGYVRPVAWRGSEMMGVSAQNSRINLAIAVWAWGKYLPDGVRLETSRWRRPSPECAPIAAKAAGLYMICTLSKHAAENNGCNDALMLDYRGQVAEATGANIFLIKDGRIHTPTPDCFLDGITRRTLIDLARARGYEVIERAIWPHELKEFSEVFLTGTAAEVTPVGQIDDLKYKAPGPMTALLMADYTALVRTA